MKKIVSFEKELSFATMIKEITSISLEHTLKFIDSTTVKGEFIISGTYKMTEASQIEEDFNYKLPVTLTTTEKYVLDSATVEIDDFTYSIVDEELLKVKIDILIEGLEEIILESDKKEKENDLKTDAERKIEAEIEKKFQEEIIKEEPKKEIEDAKEELIRECDGDICVEEDENVEEKEEIISEDSVESKEEQTTKIDSLFSSLSDAEESFATYAVHIMQRGDSLESVIDKYNTNRDAISDYNDLDNIVLGSKIIIPSNNE